MRPAAIINRKITFKKIACLALVPGAFLWSSFLKAPIKVSIATDCKETLYGYVKGLSRISAPLKGDAYLVKMKVKTESKNNTLSTADIRMVMSAKRSLYETNLAAMYQDEKEAYTISHTQKVILRTKPQGARAKSSREKQAALLQDSLFKVSTVVSCTQTLFEGKPVRLIELAPTAAGKKLFKVTRLLYYLDEKNAMLRRQEIFYLPGSPVKKKTITYERMDLKYKSTLLPAREYVYQGDRLRPEFKGYKIENEK